MSLKERLRSTYYNDSNENNCTAGGKGQSVFSLVPASAEMTLLLGSVAVLLVCAVTSGSPPPKMYEQEAQLSDGINRFSQDFYKAVAELQPGKNLIMSPLSAEVVLAMLSLGARGDTQKELLSTLHLPDADFTRAAFRPALEKLGAIEGVTLQLANKVYVKDGAQYQLDAAYRKDAEEIFRSEIENINFTAAKSAANTINSWVEQKTNNKIKDLIEESALNQDTRLVLLNAIYFKGKWDKPFKAENTMKEDFHVSSTETKKVDMMHLTDKFRYAEVPEWDATVLELPYHKHQVAMLVVLPNKVDGLPALEAKMATADLRSVLQNLRRAEVEVALPKFRIETTMDLKKTLIKMGLSRIFDNRAELGGLLQNQEPLQVSEAIQKAFIEVNEEGAEAAAATALVALGITAFRPAPLRHFRADRPFCFALLTRRERLFLGALLAASTGFS